MPIEPFDSGVSRPAIRRLPLAIVCFSVASVWGCSVPPPPDLTALTYSPSLQIAPASMEERASGLLVQNTAEGSGPAAAPGREVSIHYIGHFPDGTLLDSSLERGEPVRFHLGEGTVIPGWEEGIPGMRPGSRRRLVVPPHLGYGREGIPGHVPPNQVLVFEIRLLAVR